MTTQNTSSKLRNNEKGVASIIIVIVIMLILTLIVLAMARNSNREQRQALDRQLSSEAFYAAESGINDTIDYIRSDASAPEEKTGCDNTGFPSFKAKSRLDGPEGVISYSCILYDKHPTTLEYNDVSTTKSKTVLIQGTNGVKELTISWDDNSGVGDFKDCPPDGTLPPASAWPKATCRAGMLRLELIDPSSLVRSDLINKNFTVFVKPKKAIATPSSVNYWYRGDDQGAIANGSCVASPTPPIRKCSVTIANINLPSSPSRLLLRFKPIYSTNSVVITGTDAADNPVQFLEAQILVDSTGKANDVLRRLQVRVPVRSEYDRPDFAVQTTDSLCKLLSVYPILGDPGGAGVATSETPCKPLL